jgi:hypothetical protein
MEFVFFGSQSVDTDPELQKLVVIGASHRAPLKWVLNSGPVEAVIG